MTLSVGDGPIIRVADTGRGIVADDLPHMFDRLWRADRARSNADRSQGGSGLGLAIARRIVTDHGGTIEVTSAVGVGTTVKVALPRAEV
ncbi:ATP-binding protein [Luedemannella flava]